jgi:hypothetical protein
MCADPLPEGLRFRGAGSAEVDDFDPGTTADRNSAYYN